MRQDYQGLQYGNMRPELKETITQLGIEYRMMTQFTSFVAVEEMVVTDGGQPRRIEVPVESPEGAPAETFTGAGSGARTKRSATSSNRSTSVQANGGFIMSGPAGGQPVNRTAAANQAAADAAILNQGLAPAAMMNSAPVVNSVTASPPGPLSEADAAKAAEEQRHEVLLHKLHHSIRTVVERLRKKEALTSDDEAGFIHDGKAVVQLWLIEKSPANLAQLRELGFEVLLDVKNPRLIIGRISIDKLESLADLTFVSYVSPQVSK
jgi:hypothetical protein